MMWNDTHPTSNFLPRKPPPPRPSWRESNSYGLTPTPAGCKRNISDSTRAQITVDIVCALGMFHFVHSLPLSTSTSNSVACRCSHVTDGYFNNESTLFCTSQIHHLPHSYSSNTSRYLHWLANEPSRNKPAQTAFGPWYVIGLFIKFLISFYEINCFSSFF